jgi:hypothetical protein
MQVRCRLSAVLVAGAVASVAFLARAAAAADPFVAALKTPPAEQRKLLPRLAAAGDVRAAARMIDLELWEEMKDVPVGTPAIDAWQSLAGLFSEMTGAQVLGCVEANWIVRQTAQTPETVAARLAEARARMTSAEIKSPELAMELASWLRDFEPKDPEKARALEASALPGLEEPAAGLDPLVRATRLFRAVLIRTSPSQKPTPDVMRTAEIAARAAAAFEEAGDKAAAVTSLGWQVHCVGPERALRGDWSISVELYGRMAKLCAETGDQPLRATCLHHQAQCLQPDRNPKGDWNRAAALFEEAAGIRAAAGDKKGEANSVFAAGNALQRDKNPAGDWKRAVALFERAAILRAATGDKAGQAEALHEEAWSLQPNKNPAGDWARAVAQFERAAALYAEAGDKAEQANSLYWQGICLTPGDNPAGNWARAAAVFERVAALYAATGAKADQAHALGHWAECLRPDHDPAGDWDRAAALHAEEAALYASVRDRKFQGWSVRDQAICLIRGDKARMTPEARGLFEEAAKLLHDAGDEDGAQYAASWLK